jgi:hypothetical protein
VKTKWPAILLVALLCITLGQCSNSNEPDGSSSVKEDPSFASDIQPIFTASCAILSSCHAAPGQEGLILSQGQSYALLVNVNSVQADTLMRIRPFLPDSSYLVVKIEGNQTVGVRMPATGGPLSSTNIQLIKNWVSKGAQNN